MISIFAFIFGAIIGSFLNVVAYRYKTGMTMGGRSMCFSCGRTLTWKELFPIFSFIAQQGKCKKCSAKISIQYPLVEAGTGILFALVIYFFPPLSFIQGISTFFYLLIASILVVILIYDSRHKIIPDALVYSFAFIAFLHLFLFAPTLWDFLAGPILALPFYLLWLVSKGQWIGLGDAKLALGIGWTLGLSLGLSAIILAFWIGAIISVLWMFIVLKRFKKRYEIPFGPFLIIGMFIVLFFHVQVLSTL
jgi:prepilin signal peptidase PulO-like enzyme (type II secretory pathway)